VRPPSYGRIAATRGGFGLPSGFLPQVACRGFRLPAPLDDSDRQAGEFELEQADRTFDVAVIGGGPGGAQAALWLHKLGVPVVLLERREALGGLQALSPFSNSWLSVLPHDFLAADVARNIDRNLRNQSVSVRQADVSCVDAVEDGFLVRYEGGSCIVRAVVLATGTKVRESGHEDGNRVVAGLSHVGGFDGARSRIAVFGGGDAAFESWTMLSAKGHDVEVFARTVRANMAFRKLVPSEKVHVGDYEIDGSGGLVRCEDGEFPFDKGFVLYGWAPVLGYAAGLGLVRSRTGHVVTDGAMMSSVPGCYAVGDLVAGLHPCVSTAIGSAAQAAVALETRLGYR